VHDCQLLVKLFAVPIRLALTKDIIRTAEAFNGVAASVWGGCCDVSTTLASLIVAKIRL
jgi:hypothetical protein